MRPSSRVGALGWWARVEQIEEPRGREQVRTPGASPFLRHHHGAEAMQKNLKRVRERRLLTQAELGEAADVNRD
jgi:hypothetical protein